MVTVAVFDFDDECSLEVVSLLSFFLGVGLVWQSAVAVRASVAPKVAPRVMIDFFMWGA